MFPKLSIITINLNNKSGLLKTIESVIFQSFADYEFIIIDGGSTDGSIEVIKKHQNDIHYWISEIDSGIYNAMNKGISKAKGEYCFFLNSGDCLNKEMLKRAADECTGEDIIYFNTFLSYDVNEVKTLKYSPNLSMWSFFKKNIGHQSTLIKKSLFNSYGVYNEHNKIHSDYEFWIKSIIHGNCSCKYVDEFLSYYDMGGRSSKPNENSQTELKEILNKYIPIRILSDYEYWFNKEIEIEILMWYKRQTLLYKLLVFIYKIVKNIRKLRKMKY